MEHRGHRSTAITRTVPAARQRSGHRPCRRDRRPAPIRTRHWKGASVRRSVIRGQDRRAALSRPLGSRRGDGSCPARQAVPRPQDCLGALRAPIRYLARSAPPGGVSGMAQSACRMLMTAGENRPNGNRRAGGFPPSRCRRTAVRPGPVLSLRCHRPDQPGAPLPVRSRLPTRGTAWGFRNIRSDRRLAGSGPSSPKMAYGAQFDQAGGAPTPDAGWCHHTGPLQGPLQACGFRHVRTGEDVSRPWGQDPDTRCHADPRCPGSPPRRGATEPVRCRRRNRMRRQSCRTSARATASASIAAFTPRSQPGPSRSGTTDCARRRIRSSRAKHSSMPAPPGRAKKASSSGHS